MSWQRTPDGWRHRPLWKVAINTVLRAEIYAVAS